MPEQGNAEKLRISLQYYQKCGNCQKILKLHSFVKQKLCIILITVENACFAPSQLPVL